MPDLITKVTGKSWQTTLMFFIAGIGMALPEIINLWNQAFAEAEASGGSVNWLILISGVAVVVGGYLTRDNNKKSEDVGAGAG